MLTFLGCTSGCEYPWPLSSFLKRSWRNCSCLLNFSHGGIVSIESFISRIVLDAFSSASDSYSSTAAGSCGIGLASLPVSFEEVPMRLHDDSYRVLCTGQEPYPIQAICRHSSQRTFPLGRDEAQQIHTCQRPSTNHRDAAYTRSRVK